MSASLSPAAYSIAWLAPCDAGWVIALLNLFSTAAPAPAPAVLNARRAAMGGYAAR